jgi:hypothetical protein
MAAISGLDAAKPNFAGDVQPANWNGILFFATDTGKIYQFNNPAWTNVTGLFISPTLSRFGATVGDTFGGSGSANGNLASIPGNTLKTGSLIHISGSCVNKTIWTSGLGPTIVLVIAGTSLVISGSNPSASMPGGAGLGFVYNVGVTVSFDIYIDSIAVPSATTARGWGFMIVAGANSVPAGNQNINTFYQLFNLSGTAPADWTFDSTQPLTFNFAASTGAAEPTWTTIGLFANLM